MQVQAKREAQEREGKVPMVNLAASQEADRLRLLQLSADKGSRSAERKRARGPHRREDHNSEFQALLACSRLAVSRRLGGTQRRTAVATEALQFAPRSVQRL